MLDMPTIAVHPAHAIRQYVLSALSLCPSPSALLRLPGCTTRYPLPSVLKTLLYVQLRVEKWRVRRELTDDPADNKDGKGWLRTGLPAATREISAETRAIRLLHPPDLRTPAQRRKDLEAHAAGGVSIAETAAEALEMAAIPARVTAREQALAAAAQAPPPSWQASSALGDGGGETDGIIGLKGGATAGALADAMAPSAASGLSGGVSPVAVDGVESSAVGRMGPGVKAGGERDRKVANIGGIGAADSAGDTQQLSSMLLPRYADLWAQDFALALPFLNCAVSIRLVLFGGLSLLDLYRSVVIR